LHCKLKDLLKDKFTITEKEFEDSGLKLDVSDISKQFLKQLRPQVQVNYQEVKIKKLSLILH